MKLLTSAIIGASMFATQAFAATLSIVGGDDVALGPDYNPDPAVAGTNATTMIKAFDGTTIAGAGLRLNGANDVAFTFLGFEATAENSAVELSGGQSLGNHGASSTGDTIIAAFSDGLLNFLFSTVTPTSGGPVEATITNGVGIGGAPGSVANALRIGFLQESDSSVLAFFGDGRGDVDYDDLVIRITAIPLPAGMLLMFTALGGLGIASRRRRA